MSETLVCAGTVSVTCPGQASFVISERTPDTTYHDRQRHEADLFDFTTEQHSGALPADSDFDSQVRVLSVVAW